MSDRYYHFKSESDDEIIGSYARPQPDLEGRVERLPEDDARVQKFLGSQWARKDHQRFIIESIEDLMDAYQICSHMPPFGFRGQSRYDWDLETLIERKRDKTIKENFGIETYEQRILQEVRRRAHSYFSEMPDRKDTMAWLSLLRHYGAPTRLLDISWSIFIATFFAVESDLEKDGCVWAFNQFKLKQSLHTLVLGNNKRLFVDPKKQSGILIDQYQPPTYDPEWSFSYENKGLITYEDILLPVFNSKLVLELSLRGLLSIEGVLFIEPHWIQKRMDMQQGAFLVPIKIKTGFCSNLKSMHKDWRTDTPEIRLADIHGDEKAMRTISENIIPAVFRVKSSIKKQLRFFLYHTNVRDLVLFPDEYGLIRHLGSLVPEGDIFS